MATMNISLPDQLKAWVEDQAAGGDYASASDFVRDLLRKERERRAVIDELVALAEEGMASGISSRTVEQIRDEAKARLKAAAKRRAI